MAKGRNKGKNEPVLDEFLKELQTRFGDIRITSRTRNKGSLAKYYKKPGDDTVYEVGNQNRDDLFVKGKMIPTNSKGKKYDSHHWTGGALDIGAEHAEIWDYLHNTKSGLKLMKKYGVGIKDETPKGDEVEHSTGHHLHIGFDSSRTAVRDKRLASLENNGTLEPEQLHYVTQDKKYQKNGKVPSSRYFMRKLNPDRKERKAKIQNSKSLYPEGSGDKTVNLKLNDKEYSDAYKTNSLQPIVQNEDGDYELRLPEVVLKTKIKNSRKGKTTYVTGKQGNYKFHNEPQYKGHEPSSHLMADDGKGKAWAAIRLDKNGNWQNQSQEQAVKNNEIYSFDNKEDLYKFAREGSWKNSKKMTPEEKKKKEENELLKRAFRNNYRGGASSKQEEEEAMIKFADAFLDKDPPVKKALKKSEKNTPSEQKIIDNLKIGIAGVETGGEKNPYLAFSRVPKKVDGKIQYDANGVQIPATSARGKYQFLKVWLGKNNEKGEPRTNALGQSVLGIMDWSMDPNFGAGAKMYLNEDGTPVKNMDDFANNPMLQEAYFNYYAKAVLIPEGNKIAANGNKRGLSQDQIYAGVHFQGYSKARKQINSGEFAKKTDTNASFSSYMDKYGSVLQAAGYDIIQNSELIAMKNKATEDAKKNNTTPTEKPLTNDEKTIEKTNKEIEADYKKRNETLNEQLELGNIEQHDAERFRHELNQEFIDNGHEDIANNAIKSLNLEKEERFNRLKKIEGLLKNSSIKTQNKLKNPTAAVYTPMTTQDGPLIPGEKAILTDFTDEDKKLAYDLGILGSHENGKLVFDTKKTFDFINNEMYALTGEKIDYAKTIKLEKNNLFNVKQITGDLFEGENVNSYGNITESFNLTAGLNIPLIDSKSDLYEKRTTQTDKDDVANAKANKKDPKGDYSNDGNSGPLGEEKQKAVKDGYTDLFLNEQMGLNSVGPEQYNIGKQKREIPYDAIAGMAMGLIGNKMAREAEIPLRTEEVSEAIKNYTADLAKKAHNGLPVEVQAQMKNQLADAYQGGLEQIVNASAGNRATVLGNLSGLEAAKSKGLLAMGVANYQAKQTAFAQYGQAIQYIDSFDANRDIANHGIKYAEEQRKAQAGRDVATAGMQKLAESLQYQKENGPGSANAMYKSLLMQKMFGFDPMMKDNGKGDTKGTKSYFDRLGKEKEEKLGVTKSLQERRNNLNPNQIKIADMVMENNGSVDNLRSVLDWLEGEGANVNPEDIDMNNINVALKAKDMSYLHKNSAIVNNEAATFVTGGTNEDTNTATPTSSNNMVSQTVNTNNVNASIVENLQKKMLEPTLKITNPDSDVLGAHINNKTQAFRKQTLEMQKLQNAKLGQEYMDNLSIAQEERQLKKLEEQKIMQERIDEITANQQI